jgi:hypothetical protein
VLHRTVKNRRLAAVGYLLTFAALRPSLFEVLKEHPEELRAIKGITPGRAAQAASPAMSRL